MQQRHRGGVVLAEVVGSVGAVNGDKYKLAYTQTEE
jgi:hypothetical protein